MVSASWLCLGEQQGGRGGPVERRWVKVARAEVRAGVGDQTANDFVAIAGTGTLTLNE